MLAKKDGELHASMPVTRTSPLGRAVTFGFACPIELLDRIDAEAARHNVSRATIVRDAVEGHFERLRARNEAEAASKATAAAVTG